MFTKFKSFSVRCLAVWFAWPLEDFPICVGYCELLDVWLVFVLRKHTATYGDSSIVFAKIIGKMYLTYLNNFNISIAFFIILDKIKKSTQITLLVISVIAKSCIYEPAWLLLFMIIVFLFRSSVRVTISTLACTQYVSRTLIGLTFGVSTEKSTARSNLDGPIRRIFVL